MSTSFFQFYSLMQLFLLKAWFLYDHYDCCDHCDHCEKKSSVIAAIIWKPLSSDCSDNDRWDRIFSISAIVVREHIWISIIVSLEELWKYMIFYTLPWSRWNRTHKYVHFTICNSWIWPEMSWSSIHTKIWTLKQLHHCTQWCLWRIKMAVSKCPCSTFSNSMFK